MSSFWAPLPGRKIHFAHEEHVWRGMCVERVSRPAVAHSVLCSFPCSAQHIFTGVESHGFFLRSPPLGLPRQASYGPVAYEAGIPFSFPGVYEIPSRIHSQYTVWNIFTDSAIRKVCFIIKPLCIPNLKQSLKALTFIECSMHGQFTY